MTALQEDALKQPDMEPVVPTPLVFRVYNDRNYDPAGELPLLLDRAKSVSFSLSNSVLMRLEDRYIGGALANSLGVYMDCIEAGQPGILVATSQYGNYVEVIDMPKADNYNFNGKNYVGVLSRNTFFPQAQQAEILPTDRYALCEHIISNVMGITVGMGLKGNTASYGVDGIIKSLSWQEYCDSTSSHLATTKIDSKTGIYTTYRVPHTEKGIDLPPMEQFVQYDWGDDSTRKIRCVSSGIIEASALSPAVLRSVFETYIEDPSQTFNQHYFNMVQAPILFPPDIFPSSTDGSHTLDFEEYQAWIQENWKTQFPRLQERQTVISHKHGRIEELEM